MQLKEVWVRHFRSIGPEWAKVPLAGRICLLVGPNNSGKSNLLRAVYRIVQSLGANTNLPAFTEIDAYKRQASTPPEFRLLFTTEDAPGRTRELFGDEFWFEMRGPQGGRPTITDTSLGHIEDFNQANKILYVLGNESFGRPVGPDQFLPKIRPFGERQWDAFKLALPKVLLIPEHRRVRGPNEDGAVSLDGASLAATLARMSSPPIGEDHLLVRFEKIQGMLRDLLGKPGLVLQVTNGSQDIVLVDGALRLPLEHFGSGVHQLVVLAASLQSDDNAIFIVEEPETNLHPRLQRAFVKFLSGLADGRFLLSTHSASIIDVTKTASDVQLIQVEQGTAGTRCIAITGDDRLLAALDDLGVTPSELLQCQGVVWVEGPSDRIYLRKWIDTIAPALKEGVDYSIAYYGGKVLAHIGVERDDADQTFVQVLRIAQNSAIVIDSDREAPSDQLNETKRRVIEEAGSSGTHVWVTGGREIENYVAETIAGQVVSEQYEHPVQFVFGPYDAIDEVVERACEEAGIRPKRFDKLRFARSAMDCDVANTSVPDEVRALVDVIRSWAAD